MAPKRAKVNVSGRSRAYVPDFDVEKFVSKAAEEEYGRLRDRSIAKERGFTPCAVGDLWSMINERGWGSFCEEPLAVPMGIVREFYANAKMEMNGYVRVRGRMVDYQPSAIRRLFQLPPPPEGAQDWCMRSHEDLDLEAIVARLCIPGTQWKRSIGTNEPTTFPAKAMNRYARAWYMFLCANLMPTSHTHEVTVERATLLWGIVHDEYIDLGYFLHGSIVRYMQGGTSASIPHASVVAQLCTSAGITWGVEEQIQHPMAPLTTAAIRHMTDWAGGRPHPRGRGYIIADPAAAGQDEEQDEEQIQEQAPPPHQQRAARGVRVPRAGTSRVRPAMTDSQYQRLSRRSDRRSDTIHAMTSRFASDMIEALDDVLRDQGYETRWPTFGAHHTYPPPDSPPEEGDDV